MVGEVPTWRQLNSGAADRAVLSYSKENAQEGMIACQNLRERLIRRRKWMAANNIDTAPNPRDFSNFDSGKEWALRFRRRGAELDEILKSHIEIIELMWDTFRLANKAYQDGEDQSAEVFRELKKEAAITVPPSIRKTNIGERTSSHSGKLSSGDFADSAIANDREQYRNYVPPQGGVWPEWAYSDSLQWSNFYELGEYLRANSGIPEKVVNVAADWESIRLELESAFSDFKSHGSKITSGWEGSGAVGVQESIRFYLESTASLPTAITEIENQLLDAADWLRATRDLMPTEQMKVQHDNNLYAVHKESWGGFGIVTDPVEKTCIERATNMVRAEFQNTYVAGIEAFNKKPAVSLPSPASQLGSPAADIPPYDPKAGLPGDGAGGNGTGGGGGVPASPVVEEPKVENPGGGDPKDTVPTNPNNGNPATNNPSTTTDTTLSTLASLASTAITQGTSLVSSLATTGKEALEKSLTALTSKQSEQKQQEQQGGGSPAVVPTGLGTGGGGSGGSVGSGSGSGAGLAASPARENLQSRLFPRAAVASEEKESVTVSRAGLASVAGTGTTATTGTGMSGMPMSSGAQAGGQGAGKEHKRAEFLKSDDHLDEVFDGIPAAVRPVAEK